MTERSGRKNRLTQRLPLLLPLIILVGTIVFLRLIPELQGLEWGLIACGWGLLTLAHSNQYPKLLQQPDQTRTVQIKRRNLQWGLFIFCTLTWVSFLLPQAPREAFILDQSATIPVKIQRLFSEGQPGKKPRLRGIGVVHHAPKDFEFLEGVKVAFDCRWPESMEGIGVSSVGLIKGSLQRTDRPDAFPFEDYLAQSGIFYQLRQGKWKKTILPMGEWEIFCQKIYQRWNEILARGSQWVEMNGVYRAMLLGQTRFMTRAQKEEFSRSGTLHLFAISGLHIAVIASFIFFIFRLLPGPRTLHYLFVLSGLWIYIEATGSAPSAKRAFLMVAFWAFGNLFYRQTSALGAWVLAALIALLVDPMILFHPGFQLSYAVVAGLILYGVPLGQFLEKRYRPWKYLPESDRRKGLRPLVSACHRYLTEAVALSLAASLLSAPLIAFYFQIFSPIGILLNLPLIPLSSFIIILGLISLLMGWIGLSWVSLMINPIAESLLKMMEVVIHESLKAPGSVWELNAISGPIVYSMIALIICFGLYFKAKERY